MAVASAPLAPLALTPALGPQCGWPLGHSPIMLNTCFFDSIDGRRYCCVVCRGLAIILWGCVSGLSPGEASRCVRGLLLDCVVATCNRCHTVSLVSARCAGYTAVTHNTCCCLPVCVARCPAHPAATQMETRVIIYGWVSITAVPDPMAAADIGAPSPCTT